MNKPLFSIVIANYNYGRFLEDAIRSLLSQSCQDFELIIVDGGSTDNSVEVIKKYARGLPAGTRRDDPSIVHLHLLPSPITYWVSEKDRGQSEAFNKGFAHAQGRFLTWLNADDIFLPGALDSVRREIKRHPNGRWFVGGSVWGNANFKLQRCFRAHRFSRLRADVGMLMVGGPSSFFEKSLFDEVGGVDEELHYVMDIDLWYRFYRRAGQIYYRTTSYIWAYRIHEASKMSGPTLDPTSEINRRKRERLDAEKRHLISLYGFGKHLKWQNWGVFLSTSIGDWITAKWHERRFAGRDVREIAR